MHRRLESRGNQLRELSPNTPPSIVGVVPKHPDIHREVYRGFEIRGRDTPTVGVVLWCIRPLEATRIEHLIRTLRLLENQGCAHDKAHFDDDLPCIQFGVFHLEEVKEIIDSLWSKWWTEIEEWGGLR